MQFDITKVCADSLRTHLSNKHGIKLKSGHAHEIVAAFFGYKSRIALLADQECPTSNISKAEFILLNPPIPFVHERIKSLEGLPPGLPPSYILAEGIYPVITNDKSLLDKIWPTFRDLATFITEEHLHQQLRMFKIDLASIKWEMDVNIEHKDNGALLTVDVGYRTAAGEYLRHRQYIIHLPRVAANIGYGRPRVDETRYTGGARKTGFPENKIALVHTGDNQTMQ